MATSGSKSVTVTSWDTLKFSWWESTQTIEKNVTTIGWKLELIAGSSGKISSTASKNWSVTVNGTSYSGTNTVGISNNATKTLASGYTNITHNADGTKTFAYSFSQQFAITFGGSYIGTKSGSGNGTLDTIPRKSSLIITSGTLGAALTIGVARNSNSFTHTITAKCGSQSVTVCTKSSNTSIQYTPPLEWARENTTGTKVSVVYTITTYNGNTSLGSNSSSADYSIPAQVAPSCAVTVTDATGNADTYGAYIKGVSKFKVVVSPTIAYDSPIASYSTTANGTKYTASSFTTDALKTSGALSVAATVTDKRGRTGTATITKTVLDYAAPKISALSVHRCDADGTANDQGAYVKVKFSGSVTELNSKNTATYTLEYKKTSDSTYTEVKLADFSNNYAVADASYIFSADTGSSYNIRLSVADNFNTDTRATSASTAFTLMHWLASGLGMAIGKVAEFEGLFDVGFETKFTGGIRNIVLEKITDLNDVMTPNTYVSVNKGASTYTNCPVTNGTFVLECMSAGAEGQLFHRLTTTFKETHECYERHYYQNSWGNWVCVRSDTGWIDLELQSGITVGSECGYLKGRLKDGVLYIKGDVLGVAANWKDFAHVPAALLPDGLAASNRFSGLYNMSYLCGLNLTSGGQLYVTANSTGSWDSTKNVSVNITLCGE